MPIKVDKYELHGYAYGNDIAVVFPYPHGGEPHNNQEFLRGVALLTGGLAVGLQTPGTGKMYIDRATRARLRPGRLHELAAEHAYDVKQVLDSEGRSARVLVAHSGRVALGARMQTSPARPFTGVVLRDGTNLCAPEPVRQGYRRLTHQAPARFTSYGDDYKPLLHRLRDKRARLHGYVEVVNQGRLLCSEESIDAVQALAADPTTPLLHMTFEEGICGPVPDQYLFACHLRGIRADAATPEARAPLIAQVVPGAHGDLQNHGLLDSQIRAIVPPTVFQKPCATLPPAT
ncbi:MAG TPA: hypothetical protein VLF71_01300 [Candidatus Saccharimonadales bacterium]|nr:hypothetical protein [Candidatus Saccharimonadales bacterium]